MSLTPGIDATALNPNIRAQDDLFRHVNGIWLETTEIPEDKAIYGSFHMLADQSEEAVRLILEEAAKDPRPGVSQQIGDLYSSFLDEDRANSLGVEPIRADLEQVQKLQDLQTATKLLGQFERSGVSGLFGMYVDNDPNDPSRYLIHLYHGGLGLPDEAYYREDKHKEIRDAYVPHIAKMFSLAGFDQASAKEASKKIMEFETALASKHWNIVDSRDADKTNNLLTLEQLKKLSPSFDWDLWFEEPDSVASLFLSQL